MTSKWIAETCGGSLVGSPAAEIRGGRADSRLCRPGHLFVAIRGENADGHSYITDAWNNGADIALASADADVPNPPEGKALVLVPDPLKALQDVAAAHRRSNPGLKVAAITGSNGKTTTKDILAAIVRHKWGEKALVTRGNYNSDIGLPLMILEMNAGHEVAVLEMGMNRRGEIAELAGIARPSVSVITNIGTAHIGLLGSVEGIAEEKRHVFDHADINSTAVVGADEPRAAYLLEGYPGTVRRFGGVDPEGWDGIEDAGLDGFILHRGSREIRFSLPGRHNLANAMAAVEAALALGAGEDDIAAGLESAQAAGGRSEVRRGALTLIRDSYNANPESLGAAFDLVKNTKTPGRVILVLGEMLELGDMADEAMVRAGGAAAELRPEAMFLFGSSLAALESSAIGGGYSGFIKVFTDMDELREALAAYLVPGDLVLLKGSRGSALERLDDVLEEVGSG